MKKLIATLALLVAGPAVAVPLPQFRVPPARVLPVPVATPAPLPARPCFSENEFGAVWAMNAIAPFGSRPETCRKPTAAEQVKHDEFQKALYVHGLKEKADKVCRVTEDINLFNPYGGKWASKGDLINAVAAKPADDWHGIKLAMDASEYDHLVKDCGLGRMAQFAGNSAENQSVFAAAYSGGITADSDAGGSVYVGAHTRCNNSKCWPVRSYTRRR